MSAIDVLVAHTREVPDFPKPRILFKDLTPLFGDHRAFATVLEDVASRWRGRVDTVVGVEARGFIISAPLAQLMSVGFVPIRKAGKLPGEIISYSYDLEYGEATVEVTVEALARSRRVLLVDDVLATGGTAAAACGLVERAGAEVAGIEMLLELSFLHGRDKLPGRDVHAMQTD